MALLCWRLRRSGLAVTNFGYRSLRLTLQEAGQRLADAVLRIKAQQPDGHAPIHYVAHSMGGLVLRAAIGLIHTQLQPNQIPPPDESPPSRIVFVATPHYGAPLADRWYPWLSWIPAVRQLRTAPDSDVFKIPVPPPCFEMGTIAGQFDRIVPGPFTHIAGEKDHVLIPLSHTLIFGRSVARQAFAYISRGRFQK